MPESELKVGDFVQAKPEWARRDWEPGLGRVLSITNHGYLTGLHIFWFRAPWGSRDVKDLRFDKLVERVPDEQASLELFGCLDV